MPTVGILHDLAENQNARSRAHHRNCGRYGGARATSMRAPAGIGEQSQLGFSMRIVFSTFGGATMGVDVVTSITIRRPRTEVARYAAIPDNAPKWYVNIKSVEWRTEPEVRVGSKVAFVAKFLGRTIAYTLRS
jgi:hypothetical protein